MIYTTRKNDFTFWNNNTNYNNNSESCLSKIKSFIKSHPYIFFGIISGAIAIIVVVVVVCVVVTKKEETNEEQTIEEPKIFPLKENLKSEVMEIYNGIGNRNEGTFEAFCDYLSQKGSNLKEEQKVYLAYYWIINNIKYDHDGLKAKTVSYDPPNIFLKKTTVCSGYSRLFRKLLLVMNYTESKIKNIQGYSKGAGYSSFKPPVSNHEWNAVEINGKWCLIDTTWDAGDTSEYYLCTPPRCFVRSHLPDEYYNSSLQFLDTPISVDKFHELIETRDGYCNNNMEIIEDKAIQNICGRGKVILKYNNDLDDDDNYLSIGSFNSYSYADNFITRKNKEFQIDVSVNKKGISAIYISLNNKNVGPIYFNCTKEPVEKFYFPSTAYHYRYSDAQLITPLQRDLIKGQRYNFELKTEDFEILFVKQGQEKIMMTKNGNIFKGENIYIHSNYTDIYGGENSLVSFTGIGKDVSYPTLYSSPLYLRIYQPLKGTLSKGQEYKFEIKCESVEDIRIKLGSTIVSMDRNNNMYTKNFKIDESTKVSNLYITYLRNLTNYLYDWELYSFKLE